MLEDAGLDVWDTGDSGDVCAYLLVRGIVRVIGPLEIGSISAADGVCAGAAVARKRCAGTLMERSGRVARGRAIQLDRNSDIVGYVEVDCQCE